MLDAMNLVGATPVAALLTKAINRLPQKCLPENDELRKEALDKMAESAFDDLEDEYRALDRAGKGTWFYLVPYFEKHEAEFFN